MKNKLLFIACLLVFASTVGCTEQSIDPKGPRDASSGLATGRSHEITSPRDPASGQATGK